MDWKHLPPLRQCLAGYDSLGFGAYQDTSGGTVRLMCRMTERISAVEVPADLVDDLVRTLYLACQLGPVIKEPTHATLIISPIGPGRGFLADRAAGLGLKVLTNPFPLPTGGTHPVRRWLGTPELPPAQLSSVIRVVQIIRQKRRDAR